MQDFYSQLVEEYNVNVPIQNLNPVESVVFTYSIRRKNVAEKMVEICIRNGLSLMQAVNVLRFFANPFHYSLYPVAEILYFFRNLEMVIMQHCSLLTSNNAHLSSRHFDCVILNWFLKANRGQYFSFFI